MYGVSILLTIAIAVEAAVSTPIQARTAYSIKGKHPVPRQWTRRDRAPRTQMLQLQIGVKQSNFADLERHLYEGRFCSSS